LVGVGLGDALGLADGLGEALALGLGASRSSPRPARSAAARSSTATVSVFDTGFVGLSWIDAMATPTSTAATTTATVAGMTVRRGARRTAPTMLDKAKRRWGGSWCRS
jgi:hypothetical protein